MAGDAAKRSGIGPAYTDVESALRDAHCADCCSSLEEFGQHSDGGGRDSGGAGGWDGRHPDGGRAAGGSAGWEDGWEVDSPLNSFAAAEKPMPRQQQQQQQQQQPQYRWWRSPASGVALMCLLLTMGSFVVPESEDGIGLVMKQFRDAAKEDAQYHATAFIARLRGERHCRPPPSLLRKNTTVRVHVKGVGEDYQMDMWHDRSQPWLVPARKDGLLSIMTPVYPDNDTMALLFNQLRSANKFLNMDSIKEWVFIAPERKVPTLVNFLEEQLAHLPCVLTKKLRVVADESCAPELRPEALEQIAGNMASSIGGWMKQQLIKLACSFTIKTPYFLITDSDSFFINPLQALDLMSQKDCNATSAVCDLKKQVQFRARNEMKLPTTVTGKDQEEWLSSSAAVLNITEVQGVNGGYTMGVTPQIMSRGVLDPMAAYIEESGLAAVGETWRAYLLRKEAERLRDKEKKDLPAWTEYDIYFEYARHAGIWRRYHTHAILQRFQANLWTKEDYPTWNPCDEDDLERLHGYWAVVQSTLHLGADVIWEKLGPCMQHK